MNKNPQTFSIQFSNKRDVIFVHDEEKNLHLTIDMYNLPFLIKAHESINGGVLTREQQILRFLLTGD